ncbi:hypothetical protein FRAHR75_770011 [Frankia sp. Hr75.2]|nr:hypothetical protein FRAHR75_770011 [Frankia sp. Hr75.2]
MFIMPDPAAGLPDFAPLAGSIFETDPDLRALDEHDGGQFAKLADVNIRYGVVTDPKLLAQSVEEFGARRDRGRRAPAGWSATYVTCGDCQKRVNTYSNGRLRRHRCS